MSLASGDLTTLAAAKAYLTNAPSDAVISGLISRVSSQIRSILNRRLLVPSTYTQQFSGQNTRQLVLPEYPLLSLSSLVVGGVSVPVAPQVNSVLGFGVPFGYRFQPWDGRPPGEPAILDLIGFSFRGGFQNVVVSYSAGYAVQAEAQVVPAVLGPYTIAPAAPYGSWATDQGVVYAATGLPLVAVGASPAAGQYVPPSPGGTTPTQTYLFSSADATKPVLLSYGFIPGDLEQAALDLIAERTALRNRPGLHSMSLASQETFSFDRSGIPAHVVEMLRPYESVLPPAMGAPV